MKEHDKIIDAEDVLAYARDCITCAAAASAHIHGKEGEPIETVIDIAGEKIDAALALLHEYRGVSGDVDGGNAIEVELEGKLIQ
jgi:hypothetical protein